MMERVASQRGVVRLNVNLNLFLQSELFQETINCGDIVIILMFCRLLRFWLNQQRPLEASFMFMLDHHLHKAANLLALLTQIGIQQGFIAFAPAPQHIVFAAQGFGGLHGAADLRRRPGKNLRIGISGSTRTIARMGKAVCRAPQQFHAGFLLFLQQFIGHGG